MVVLSLIFGTVVGFSLGLTGGGGSIFAVPLLVYGLAVAPREAVGISLAAVGATALVGALQRLRAGEVELRIGIFFAAAGMLGAPLGTWLSGYIPDTLLLVLFACLMLFVAVRMWRRTTTTLSPTAPLQGQSAEPSQHRLDLRTRGTRLLAALGLSTGILSGLFGVGGGFVIVPALVLGSAMPIHRAIATSLVVIALISTAGIASALLAGRTLGLAITGLFVLGGVGGMGLGTHLSHRLSGPHLQRGFALALVGVAVFIITSRMM